MALIYLSCAWVAGIYLGSKFALPLALIFIGLAPLPLLFLFHQHRKTIILAAVCLIAFFGGALCFQASLPPDNESHLQFYNNKEKEVEIKGVIKADPEVRDKATHIRLSATEIKEDNGWQEVSGDALLFVHRYPDYHYSDVLIAKGRLETPPQLDDFDYKGYLERQGIYSTMLYPDIEILETGKGFKPLEWAYGLRNRLFQTLAQVLPEPQASLAQGVILGIRYNIPAEIKDNFVQTGTAHILAISGVNLSIIAGMLLSIGIWLFGKRRYIYVWPALGIIWLYTLITGMNPPVVRGAIMASLFLAAAIWLGSHRTRLSKATTWVKSGVSKSTDLVSQIPKRYVIPPLLVLAILSSVAAASMPDDKLHISFLDVGQGDAILIQKGSQQALIDGGPSPQALTVGLGEQMPFWDRTIELVILTHPHSDHLAGLLEVLPRYKVNQVLYPDLDYKILSSLLDYESSLYDEWLDLIKEKDIKYTLAQAGQQIDLGDGVIIKVLNPQTPLLTGTASDINNNSVVLRLTMGRASFLLAADIKQEAESKLIGQRADLAGTVLKVAHHGSATSTSPEFLAVVDPKAAVISVGENRYGHPSDEVVERLKKEVGSENIFRTDKQGTIEFITDGERLWGKIKSKHP